MSVSICSRRGDIISYLHSRLAADRTLGAMGSALEADILEKVPSDILEMRITCFNCSSSANRSRPVGQKSRGATVQFCGYFIPGGQKCMSFCATEPSPKRNLRIRNKTYKPPTTTTTPLRTPGAESQPAQVKFFLELTLPVKKVESLAKLLVICTRALSQLVVAAG